MMDKIKGYILTAAEKAVGLLPKVKAQDSMGVIFAYGILLAIISISFVAAWVYNGINAGKFNTDEMIKFFSVATGVGPVAAVTFLSVFLVDKNDDGRPDAAEDRAEREDKR